MTRFNTYPFSLYNSVFWLIVPSELRWANKKMMNCQFQSVCSAKNIHTPFLINIISWCFSKIKPVDKSVTYCGKPQVGNIKFITWYVWLSYWLWIVMDCYPGQNRYNTFAKLQWQLGRVCWNVHYGRLYPRWSPFICTVSRLNFDNRYCTRQ